MVKKSKNLIVVFFLVWGFLAFGKTALAANIDIGQEFLLGPGKPIGAVFGTLGSLVTVVLRLLFAMGALAAFIMILVGSYRYLFSGGDPKGAEDARNTITYAIIGMAVIILAFVIVRLIGVFLGYRIV